MILPPFKGILHLFCKSVITGKVALFPITFSVCLTVFHGKNVATDVTLFLNFLPKKIHDSSDNTIAEIFAFVENI